MVIPKCNAQSVPAENKQNKILEHPANEVGDFGDNKPKKPKTPLIYSEPTTVNVKGRLIKGNDDSQNAQSKSPPTDYGPYMADIQRLQRSIKKHWLPPKGNENKKVTVEFKVLSDGQLSDLHVLESSGVKEADDAALKAVKDSAPFKPLSLTPKENSVDIKFTFDYNAFNHTN